MFSSKIDDIWHFFLAEQELYREFCLVFIGEQIEHHPHDTPKQLPNERAWFDILYLSFFNITSHSHLWGEFVQKKQEHAVWVERIVNDPEEIIQSLGRHSSDATSVRTLTSFLNFAGEQIMKMNNSQDRRVKREDGYWY